MDNLTGIIEMMRPLDERAMAEARARRDTLTKPPGSLGRLEKHTSEETILIVAHAGPLRPLIYHLLEIEPWYWRQLRTDIASLSILETYLQGAILNSLDDVSHLI